VCLLGFVLFRSNHPITINHDQFNFSINRVVKQHQAKHREVLARSRAAKAKKGVVGTPSVGSSAAAKAKKGGAVMSHKHAICQVS